MKWCNFSFFYQRFIRDFNQDVNRGVFLRRRVFSVLSLIFLCFSGLSGLSGCIRETNESASETAESQVPEVTVFTVKSEPLAQIYELPGRTAAFNAAQVRPQVNGIILRRNFTEGSFVKEGDSLFEIDSAVYQANYNKALAHMQNTELALKRTKRLQETSAVSVQECENALSDCEQARADLELARLNLDYCSVKAPLSGKIGLSLITVGALVTSGQAEEMAVIQQLDPIYVDLKPAVPQILGTRKPEAKSFSEKTPDETPGETQTEAPVLPFWQGAKVTVTLEDGSEYPHAGVIRVLDNHVEEDTGTVTVRAEIPNPDSVLLPGMFVHAFVEEKTLRGGILVPQQSVCRDFKGNPYVWTVSENQKAEIRNVQTGRTFGNMIHICEGLADGDRVIVEGIQFVTAGGSVSASGADISGLKKSY